MKTPHSRTPRLRTLLAVSLVLAAVPAASAQNLAAELAQTRAAQTAAIAARDAAVADWAANGAALNAAGSAQWARGVALATDLNTKDPAAPGYDDARNHLYAAEMELQQAAMLLDNIPEILATGQRHIDLGDGKLAQGIANMAGDPRVAWYAFWSAQDWYRIAVNIYGRVQARIAEAARLIASATAHLDAAAAIIAGLPAPPPMPMPMPAPGPMPGPGPMPMPMPMPMP